MWKLGSEIVGKLEAIHILFLLPIVALCYVLFMLIKMMQKRDERAAAAFNKKDDQLLSFADKTFEHTTVLNRLVDMLSTVIGKLK